MFAACDLFGNPSSVHAEGRAARAILDEARRQVSALTGAVAENVVFTSGGTEALNIALTPDFSVEVRRLLIGAGEHPAVLNGHRFGTRAEIVPLKANGALDLEALERQIAGEPVMLALQAANNETGVVQPVRAAADLVHATGGVVVCDAVQAVGKIDCEIGRLGADAIALSAHKFGGPKGVGALCFGSGRHHLKHGPVRGGGQERGLRGGTENIVGIAGLGAAAEQVVLAGEGCRIELAGWRDAIERIVVQVAPSVVVFGAMADRLPNTTCFAVPGIDSQVLLMNLDLNGVAVSAGSACAAGKVKPSHVLAAMGVEAGLAMRALRVSLGRTTVQADIDAFASAFASALKHMRPRRAA